MSRGLGDVYKRQVVLSMKAVAQSKTISKDWLVCRLLEIFYILSFFAFTYQYNINILYASLLFVFIPRQRNKPILIGALAILILLVVPYFIIHDSRASYRIAKTLAVFMPLFFMPVLERTRYRLSSFFHVFMVVNAWLVYIDFFLFFTTGRTIMHFTTTGILPRPCGLIEDSNFFSYLMVVYCIYRKRVTGLYSKFLLGSVVLSGSLSAVLMMLFLLLFYKVYKISELCARWRYVLGTALCISFYFCIVLFSENIVDYIRQLDVNELVKFKSVSMILRLQTQHEALMYLLNHDPLCGVGAGLTTQLMTKGINLHNGYLQLFFEMGALLLVPTIILIVSSMVFMRDAFYIPLFCVLLILGNILDIVYFPLLSFVFFISFTPSVSQIFVSDARSNIAHDLHR